MVWQDMLKETEREELACIADRRSFDLRQRKRIMDRAKARLKRTTEKEAAK